MSNIEWTDKTWNPVTGCDKVSPGCDNCYAEAITLRFPKNFPSGFKVMLRPDRLDDPLRWRKSSHVFVNSMSDLFHPDVPYHYIDKIFGSMQSNNWHRYQVLTKRPKTMAHYLGGRKVPSHIWLGTSIEDKERLYRIDQLRHVRCDIRFLSLEPLLEDLGDIDLHGIEWVIVGGESGPNARPMELDWVRSIRDQCVSQDVPFFYKQFGGRTPKSGGRTLDGRTWDEMPQSSPVAWTTDMAPWS